MNARNISLLAELIDNMVLPSRTDSGATAPTPASVSTVGGLQTTGDGMVECISCGEMHEAQPHLYLGRERYACSDKCWDEWVNFGRWERPE